MKIIAKLSVLCLAVLFLSCNKIENFLEIETPRFSGSYAPDQTSVPEELKIVSFNIEFAEKVEEAIDEIRTSENLQNADLILLQEMDEVGTELIARTFDYDYVYYPSNRNLNGQLFGLAILSKWPIVDDEKILLPHETPVNERKRIAMSAQVMIGDEPLRVYNIHASTLSVPKANRREQFRTLMYHLNDLEENEAIPRVLIAGDFNTDKDVDIDYLVDIYQAEGFDWISEDIGPTYQIFSGFATYRLDHVFTRGFDLIEAGKNAETQASDHVPVWVRLRN